MVQNDNSRENDVLVRKLQGCCWEYSAERLYFTNNRDLSITFNRPSLP